MGDNTKIVLLENKLVDTLNESKLPIIVKKMVVERVLAATAEAAERTLQEEAIAEKAESEEKEDGIRTADLG